MSKVQPQVLQGQPIGGAFEAARWEKGEAMPRLPEVFQLQLSL